MELWLFYLLSKKMAARGSTGGSSNKAQLPKQRKPDSEFWLCCRPAPRPWAGHLNTESSCPHLRGGAVRVFVSQGFYINK